MLIQSCAVGVPSERMQAIVAVESGQNPFAIGVVGGRLQRQPRTLSEALATAEMLQKNNWNFSLGVAQVNRYNLSKYNLDFKRAFDPCLNLQAGAKILSSCFERAKLQEPNGFKAWEMAYSCYYAGDFTRGYKLGYVQRVLNAGMLRTPVTQVVEPQVVVSQNIPTATPSSEKTDVVILKRAPNDVSTIKPIEDVMMVVVDGKLYNLSHDVPPVSSKGVDDVVQKNSEGPVLLKRESARDKIKSDSLPVSGDAIKSNVVAPNMRQDDWQNTSNQESSNVFVF